MDNAFHDANGKPALTSPIESGPMGGRAPGSRTEWSFRARRIHKAGFGVLCPKFDRLTNAVQLQREVGASIRDFDNATLFLLRTAA